MLELNKPPIETGLIDESVFMQLTFLKFYVWLSCSFNNQLCLSSTESCPSLAVTRDYLHDMPSLLVQSGDCLSPGGFGSSLFPFICRCPSKNNLGNPIWRHSLYMSHQSKPAFPDFKSDAYASSFLIHFEIRNFVALILQIFSRQLQLFIILSIILFTIWFFTHWSASSLANRGGSVNIYLRKKSDTHILKENKAILKQFTFRFKNKVLCNNKIKRRGTN